MIDKAWPLLFLCLNDSLVTSTIEDEKGNEDNEQSRMNEIKTDAKNTADQNMQNNEESDILLRRDVYRRVNRANIAPITTSIEAMVLVIHTILLQHNFTCIFHEPPSKNGPKGFAPPTRMIPPETFVPPNWNADPNCITLTYRPPGNTTVAQFTNSRITSSQSRKVLYRNQKDIDEVSVTFMTVEEDILLQFQEKKKKQEPVQKQITIGLNEYFKGLPELLGFPFCMHSLDKLQNLIRNAFLIPSYYPDEKEIQNLQEREEQNQRQQQRQFYPGEPPFRNNPRDRQFIPDYPDSNPFPDFHGDLVPGVGGGNLMGPNDPFFRGPGFGGNGRGGLSMPRPRFDPYGPGPVFPGSIDPNDPRYRDAYQPDPDHLPPPGVNSDFNDLRRGNGRGGRGSGSRGGLGGGVGGGGFDNMYM